MNIEQQAIAQRQEEGFIKIEEGISKIARKHSIKGLYVEETLKKELSRFLLNKVKLGLLDGFEFKTDKYKLTLILKGAKTLDFKFCISNYIIKNTKQITIKIY